MARRKLYDEHGREVKVRRRGGCLKWVGIIILLFVVGGMFGAFDADESEPERVNMPPADVTQEESEASEIISENETAESVEAQEDIAEEPTQFDNPIEQAAHDVFGSNLEEFNYIEYTEHIVVESQMGDNLSGSWIISGFEMDIMRFLEKVQNESFESVYIAGYFDLIDTYGNEKNHKVYSIDLTKSEIDKINFGNFDRDNLKNIADGYQVHNALQ